MTEIFKFDSGYFDALVWIAWIGIGIIVVAATGFEIARSKNRKRDDDEPLP